MKLPNSHYAAHVSRLPRPMTDERFPHIEHEMFLEWVVPKGDHDETYWRAMLQAMVDAQRATGKGRIFIDRSSGPAEKPVEPMVVYRMALLMAESFGAAVRVAVQSPAAGTDNFFEDVATNRGATVRVGVAREPLIEWLLLDE
ncbi:hypothetical protein ACYFX5_16540 [Bremerella sp. T1]|uniref:hypothetical protein n=1 Tax=Bremerella sp. TYQ1 TaxID=3119568 RepID=UPI001CCC4C79|nr:hypothetical protein [Bremerella volcania]UBM34667.1 hypothetical protein LA756_18490 [Bremerella volcania]